VRRGRGGDPGQRCQVAEPHPRSGLGAGPAFDAGNRQHRGVLGHASSAAEEDEEVFVHPRDPYTRIDVLRSSRHVRVRVAGTLVADSTRPPDAVCERSAGAVLPAPRGHAHRSAAAQRHHPRCPYKGTAHDWSLRVGQRFEPDIVWSYPEPGHDADAVRGLLCFIDERVELDVSADEQRH